VTFTPEPGFTADPTPIQYTVTDETGKVSNPATVAVNYGQNPSITVEKTGTFNDTNGDGYADVGETIQYSFTVKNTGDVPLSNVNITDVNATVTGGPIDLAVGESDSATFIGTHSITIDDIIAGAIHNQATVTAKDPSGNDVNDTSDDPTTSTNDDPTIINVSPRPPISTDDNQSLQTGEDAVIDIIKNDNAGVFPLNPQSVTLTEPSNATNRVTDNDGDIIGFTVAGEGSWSVNPETGQVTFSPEDGYVGDPTPVEYTVADEQGNETSSMININYPPVANDDSNTSLSVGQTATLAPLANDHQTSSPFDPESINFVVPNGATGSDTDGDGDIDEVIVPGEGTWTANVDGTVTFVPEKGLIGNPTPMKYTAKEIDGDVSNVATLSVSYVSGSNVPQAVDDGVITITHYGPTVIDILNNDTFGTDGPNIGEIEITSQPAHGTVSLDNHGTPNDPTDDVFIFEPEPNVPLVTDTFTYTITDANGDTSTATVTLDINCASTQTSDSGESLGIISMLMMIFMTIMTGLYLIRKEENIREEV
jgi:CshA-type fibril repeat protein